MSASDGKKNRLGEACPSHLLVGFRHGDPNRPYVMGSLFNGTTGAGGSKGNKIKSITTRSGSSLLLDDSDGSVTLHDHEGVSMMFDGNGNAAINTKESHLVNAGSNSTIYVGSSKGVASVLSMDKNGKIYLKGDADISIMVGGSIIEVTNEEISISSAKVSISGNEIEIKGKGTWQGGKIKIKIN